MHSVHEVDAPLRSLLAEFERNITALDNNNKQSPTTAGQVSGGLGAQGMTMLDRVLDSSLIPNDQHGLSALTTHSTDTAPDAAQFSGVADICGKQCYLNGGS